MLFRRPLGVHLHLSWTWALVAISITLALVGMGGALVTAQGPVRLSFSPAYSHVATGDSFDVRIDVKDALDLNGVWLVVHFDPQRLQVEDADLVAPGVQIRGNGSLWGGRSIAETTNKADNVTGVITYTAFLLGGSGGITGSGTIATIPFRAVSAGFSALTFDPEHTEGDAGENLQPVELSLGEGLVGVDTHQIYLPLGLGRP